MGLNDSKYQYVIDALEADKYRRERDERDEEDRRQASTCHSAENDVFLSCLFIVCVSIHILCRVHLHQGGYA